MGLASRWLDRPLLILLVLGALLGGQFFYVQRWRLPEHGICIRTSPPGASVYRLNAELFIGAGGEVSGGTGEVPVGTTPGPLHLPSKDLPATLIFRLPGYKALERSLPSGAFDRDRVYPTVLGLEPESPVQSLLTTLRAYPFLLTTAGFGLWLLGGWRSKNRADSRHRAMVERIGRGEVRPGDQLGDYIVEEKVGAGGMGQVFRVHRVGGEKEERLALKLLHQEGKDRSRFEGEVRACAAVQHPNLVYLLDWGEVAGRLFMVTEFVTGKTLDQVLDGPASLSSSLEWAHAIAEALLAVHRAGLVHRDVKPANVAVDERGRVKLMDFGIALFQGETGNSAGTPGYSAPEQLGGQAVDYRADLYALGALTYEALSGDRPFPGKTPWETVQLQQEGKFTPLSSEIPAALRHLVQRLLDPNPESRADSPEQVLGEFRGLDNSPAT